MIVGVYAVKDTLTDEFMQPAFLKDESAKRWFNEVINVTNIIKNNPTDYEMYKLAIYNTETGMFENDFQKVCTAAQVKAERGETDGLR